MTRDEFNAWLEQHYGELLAVAKRRVKADPEDALQAALARVTEHLDQFDETKGRLWTWVVNAIRSTADTARQSASRVKRLRADLKKDPSAAVSLGWKRPGVFRANANPTETWEANQ